MQPRRRNYWDRGSMALEGAVSWIVAFGVFAVFSQLVMWGLAVDSARSAASAALYDAQVEHGTAGGGSATAARVIDIRAGATLQESQASVERGEAIVTVTVTGHAYPLPLPVSVTVTGPTERFVPEEP